MLLMTLLGGLAYGVLLGQLLRWVPAFTRPVWEPVRAGFLAVYHAE